MRRKPIPRRGQEHGVAAVEFGLIAVVLLTLLIGIIQYAIFFWAYQVAAHGAREGARLGAVQPCDTAAISNRVTSRIGSAAVSGTGVSVETNPPTGFKIGDELTVEVTFSIHEIGLFSVPQITKSATARIENVPAGGC